MSRASVRRALAAVLLLCALACLAGSVRTHFTGKDELRYAQIAKEMVRPGDYFFLHYQGQMYPDKPPLFFWMARAGFALTDGVSPFGLRLPNILCTLFTAMLCFDIGRRFFGRRAGLLAAAFYALSFRTIYAAHMTKLDPPLVLFCTLALWYAVRGLEAQREGRRPGTGLVVGFWAAMGLGFLVKGPLGLVVPLGSLLCYRLAARDWRRAAGRETLLGPLVFLAVLAVWVVPGLYFGGLEYARTIVGQELIERAADPWRHTKEGLEDIVYYQRLWLEFLPGSLLFPAAALLAWRERRRLAGSERQGLLFVLAWFVFLYVFFTLMRSKRSQYILPLYPAAALWVGWLADRLWAGRAQLGRRWAAAPLGICGVLGLLLAVAALLPLRGVHEELDAPMPWLVRLAALALLGGLGAWTLWRLREPFGGGALTRMLLLVPLALTIWFGAVLPLRYRPEPYRQMAAYIDALTEPGDLVYTKEEPDPNFNIYGHYFLRHLYDPGPLRMLGHPEGREPESESVIPLYCRHPEPLLLLLNGKRYERYPEQIEGFRVHALRHFDMPRYRDEGGIWLLSNQPRPRP